MTARWSLVGASALALVTVLTLGGCAGPRDEMAVYAALGDSYSSAPYVPVTNYASGCLRSAGNYAHLVAAELDSALADVTCVAAPTDAVLGSQTVPGSGVTVPPQIEAVTADADLVTVGLGWNDGGTYAKLISGCLAGSDAQCRSRLTSFEADDSAAGFTRRLGDLLVAVHKQAPAARVLVIGYPRIVSIEETCPDIRLERLQRQRVVAFEESVNTLLAEAAARTDSVFVDLREVSKGHELCSGDPWINGPVTDKNRAMAYHPFAAEQEAVAARVLEVLKQ